MDVRGGKVCEALQDIALDLQDWSRNVLGVLEKRIKKTRKALVEKR